MTVTAGFDAGLDSPFAGDGATSTAADVPARFDVAIAGRSYIVDLANDLQGFRGTHLTRKSISLLRNQADTANTPGEQSLNRDDFWRRTQDTWHHGSGQINLDRADSDSARFHTSKGVDCWTKWTLKLLNDTTRVLSSANTNLRLTACGTLLYLADGQALKFTPNIVSTAFTTVTGTPASACTWVTSDGGAVYAAYGVDVYKTAAGASSAATFSTGFGSALTVLGYVKGRLMAAAANSIYNITAGGAAPAALLTHSNTDFTWVGFAEGPGFIYAAGYSGTRSLIYKITLQPDGTALTSPSVAGELPTGETVRTIKGYLGFVLVGTDTGIRVASPDAQGNLTFGPLIATTSAVLNFEPQDRFVWYALTNYDSTSTGLGRLDLSVFTEPLAPAHATDLMATAQGAVTSVSSYGTRRVLCVSGQGVWVEATVKVPSGNLSSGNVAYGIGDDKVAMYLDLRTEQLNGSVGASISADRQSPVVMDTFNTQGGTRPSQAMNCRQSRGEFFELTVTLTRSTVDTTLGPVVSSYTLRAYPTPNRSYQFIVPILIHETVQDRLGTDTTYDVYAERQRFEALLASQELVAYQEGAHTYTVLVDDVWWVPVKRTLDGDTYSGTLVAFLKEMVA